MLNVKHWLTILAICLTACSKPANFFETTTSGPAFALVLTDARLNFCDNSGSHSADLPSGQISPGQTACPSRTEANTACSGLPGDPSVRSLPSQPSEIIDAGTNSYSLEGRVQDCAAHASRLAVATNATVLWLDTRQPGIHLIQQSGGDRVTIGKNWIAWTSGHQLRARSIEP